MGIGKTSSDYLIDYEETNRFQPGKEKDEILRAIGWRGNLELAITHKGKRVCAISYGLFGGPHGNDHRGSIVWAIFVDDRFSKFVEWPDWGEKAIALGSFDRLTRASESEAIDLKTLAEKQDQSKPAHKEINPGLARAWLHLRGGVVSAHNRDLQRNTELRDQFNAARLRFGMTTLEVESTLHSKPLCSGVYSGGSFKVYGGTETLDVLPYHHYSNVLALFDNGKLTGLYSGYTVPGGKRWREELQASFTNLGKMDE